MDSSKPLLPGATIGILGSGQLGRMLALAARSLGYRVHIFSPEKQAPAAAVADREFVGDYEDATAVQEFAATVDVVTFEFENVPVAATRAAAAKTAVRPQGEVLHITQNRLREKSFLRENGFPVTPFSPVHSLQDLSAAVNTHGLPGVLKTADFGYDGKGQVKITDNAQLEAAWNAMKGQSAIYERFVSFQKELSVVGARSLDGGFSAFPVFENDHSRHILDLTLAPARIPAVKQEEAVELARRILDALQVVGVLTVEMFLGADGTILVNELAPRVHNSGHLSIDACVTSQFEQQVRAVCGLPLGSTQLHSPAAMANLLGDLWKNGEPHWSEALQDPWVKLHLYGKTQPRPGRKMGHLTACAHTLEAAADRVLSARARLTTESD